MSENTSKKPFVLKQISKISYVDKTLTFPVLAALTPKNHEIEVLDASPSEINYDENYDLVGITCITATAYSGYRIADRFRKKGVPVVLGGWHPSVLAEEAKQHADSVVIGEAENIWTQLLKDLENNRLKPFYKQTKPVDPKLIPHPLNIYPRGTKIIIQAARGCPYGCEFCAISSMKHRRIYRTRPVNNVIEEIKSLPAKIFTFQDNSLTVNTDFSKQLFQRMKDLNKKFGALGNIDVLGKDDEFLRLANEAGCISWFIGFESISQKTINNLGKKTNKVKEYKTTIKKIHDYGMTIIGSFAFGFDNDTLDVFENTDEFVRKSDIDVPAVNILTPYPGTPLYNRYEKEGRILTKDWSKYTQFEVVFKPKHMKPEELKTNTFDLYKRWYSKPLIIKRIFKSIGLGLYPLMVTLSQNIIYSY